MATRTDYVKACRAYLGVPFRHQGRTSEGLDCLGLVLVALHDIALTDFDYTAYGPQPDSVMLRAELASRAMMSWPLTDAWGVGDVVLMRVLGEPQHLAVATDSGIIHAYAPAGRVVEHAVDEAWMRRAYRAYAVPGLEEG